MESISIEFVIAALHRLNPGQVVAGFNELELVVYPVTGFYEVQINGEMKLRTASMNSAVVSFNNHLQDIKPKQDEPI